MKTHVVVKHIPCLDHEIDFSKFTSKDSMRNLYKDNYSKHMWKLLTDHYKNLTQ